MLKWSGLTGVPSDVDKVSVSMLWARVGLTMLLLYKCVSEQHGRFRLLHRLRTGRPTRVLRLVSNVRLSCLVRLCPIRISMFVVRLVFTMLTCVPGYTYRKCGLQVWLYTLQPLVLKSLLTTMANPGIPV